MRVVVVGGGAVGTFVGATLAFGGGRVTLVTRRPETTSPIAVVNGPVERVAEVSRVTSADLATLPPPDAVVLAVKQPSLRDALATVSRWPSPVVTLQNGIGAEALVAEQRPDVPLVAASLTTAVVLEGEGRVRRLRRGGIGLAAVTPDARSTAHELAATFRRGGLDARVYRDDRAMKWSKLLGNLVGNATSAVLDLDPAEIYADPTLFAVERAQLREALAVMDALGIPAIALPGADARLLAIGVHVPPLVARPVFVRVVAGARGGKSPSLRLDVTAGSGGSTEVRWLNGAVADAGRRLGIETPVNEALVRLVEAAASDADRRAAFRGNRDALLAETAAPG